MSEKSFDDKHEFLFPVSADEQRALHDLSELEKLTEWKLALRRLGSCYFVCSVEHTDNGVKQALQLTPVGATLEETAKCVSALRNMLHILETKGGLK